MAKKRDTVIWPQNKAGKDIVWFSCGAASFITTKIAVQENPNVEVVYIDVGWEHEDNHRFLKEAEKALGIKVKIIKHPTLATPAEVFKKRRYITSIAGAPCTQELKKRVRQKYETGLELQYFGFHAGEEKRRERFLASNEEQRHLFRFPLIEHGYTKEDCLSEVAAMGILPPITYRLGYSNANCIGCVKGGRGYWKKIREDFPERFAEMVALEEEIGYTIFRTAQRKGVTNKDPVKLKDIDWDQVKEPHGLSWDCGILCVNELPEDEPQMAFDFEQKG